MRTKNVAALSAPTKKEPGFGIIAPVAYLHQYASQSNFHLALAHLVDTNAEYAKFYRKMSERGDFIIMDNGAYELGKSYEPKKLITLAKAIEACALVLPDYPGEPAEKTINAAQEMYKDIKDEQLFTFFCPQGKIGDLEDWINAYMWASQQDWIDMIGMSILGIPNALPHIAKPYVRVVMTQILIERKIFAHYKYHHYLGLNAGPNLELPSLIRMGALNSCDSSGPVWAGICGHSYTLAADSFQSTRKIDKHVDFDYPLTNSSHVRQAIQTNIDMTLSLFR